MSIKGRSLSKAQVEEFYKTIQKREGSIKLFKNLALILFFASVAIFLLYPLFTIGGEKFSFVNLILAKETDVIPYQIFKLLIPVIDGEWNGEVFVWFSVWYLILKVVIFVFTFIIGFFKFIFGGFIKLFKKKEVPFEKMNKVVEKYIKKHDKTILKKIIAWLLGFLVELIFPTLGDLLNLKDSASSLILPIVYALMCVLCLFIPLNALSNTLVIESATLIINTGFLFIAMILGILHTLLILVATILELVFDARKLI